MLKTYSLLWFGLLMLAFINAGIRELGYGKHVSELSAHQISTVTGCILITIFTYIISRIRPITSYTDSLKIGIIWVTLTVIFETAMVVIFMKKDLAFLLNSYNIFRGQLWPVFLLWTGVLPFIFKK
ncbi:MAG: hypothetical protein GWN11_09265 [Candidatus Dadabacteria bacterium]|nr:hypothetical protein [Candidatus Dadabacteria bacterium]